MLGLNILVIYRRYVKKEMAEVNFNMQVVNDEYERLGKMAKDEYYVAICFAIAMVNVVIVAQVVTPLYGECVVATKKK